MRLQSPLCRFQPAEGFSLLLHLQGFLLINIAESLYKLKKRDMKYWWAAETPSDRPSYLQTDPDQLIHLLFLPFICWLSKLHPGYIASHQSSFLCEEVNRGIPPNLSQLLWSRAAAGAACSCWGSWGSPYFSLPNLLYYRLLALAIINWWTRGGALVTATPSQMCPRVSQLFHYANTSSLFFF